MASWWNRIAQTVTHVDVYSHRWQGVSYFKRKGFNKRSIIDSAVGHSTGHRIQKPRTAAIMKRNPGFWRISSVEASSISKPGYEQPQLKPCSPLDVLNPFVSPSLSRRSDLLRAKKWSSWTSRKSGQAARARSEFRNSNSDSQTRNRNANNRTLNVNRGRPGCVTVNSFARYSTACTSVFRNG